MTFQQIENTGGEADICAAHEAEKERKELWDKKSARAPTFARSGCEKCGRERDHNKHRRHRAPGHGGRLRAHHFFGEAEFEFDQAPQGRGGCGGNKNPQSGLAPLGMRAQRESDGVCAQYREKIFKIAKALPRQIGKCGGDEAGDHKNCERPFKAESYLGRMMKAPAGLPNVQRNTSNQKPEADV